MPCTHCKITIIKRRNNESAVSAAYQSGEKLFSEYDQEQKYYPYKNEVTHKEIMLPPHAPPEYADRNTLWKLTFSLEMVRYLKERQRDFMPEDTKAGMIQAFLDSYPGDTVCSKQLYKEALNHDFDEPKQWEIREINEIMNQCVTGWKYFSNPRMFTGYGRQKGWEREQKAEADACALATDTGNGAGKTPEGFTPVPEQMELPF